MFDPGAYSRLQRGGSLNFRSKDNVDFNFVHEILVKKRASQAGLSGACDGASHERVIHRLLHSICVQSENLGISAAVLSSNGDKQI